MEGQASPTQSSVGAPKERPQTVWRFAERRCCQDELLKEAEKGVFWSYACGVAAQIMTRYNVGGLEIDNYRTTLPPRKGLSEPSTPAPAAPWLALLYMAPSICCNTAAACAASHRVDWQPTDWRGCRGGDRSSSAAICVMVARAFNRLYDLKLTVQGEMEMAYYGEISTPSRCGRMDQCVAYGNRCVLMKFDGDALECGQLQVAGPIHMLLVDLGGDKDTIEILQALGKGFPFPRSESDEAVLRLLGDDNLELVDRACCVLQSGDAAALGALMVEQQARFDRVAGPTCPAQFAAPLLHGLLSHPGLQGYIHGGKGVGSQGDGTAQLVCKDAAAVVAATAEITAAFPAMSCLPLVLGERRRVRVGLIPAGGHSVGLFPMSKVLTSAMLPVLDSDGVTKPAILIQVEQAIAAGIERLVIVVNASERRDFERLFYEKPTAEMFNQLGLKQQEYSRRILKFGEQITLVDQQKAEGFGHAVLLAKEAVGVQEDESFLLMLGDHLFRGSTQPDGSQASCIEQMLQEHERSGNPNVIGLYVSNEESVQKFGVLAGTFSDLPADGGAALRAAEGVGAKQLPQRMAISSIVYAPLPPPTHHPPVISRSPDVSSPARRMYRPHAHVARCLHMCVGGVNHPSPPHRPGGQGEAVRCAGSGALPSARYSN